MSSGSSKKYKGVRQRKWGKWVSEIRVPGSPERLWLGTYATPEAAAVAHDVAFYCLRGPLSLHKLNFPDMLPSSCVQLQRSRPDMSPRSAQAAASEAGMAVDAKNVIEAEGRNNEEEEEKDSVGEEEALTVEVGEAVQNDEKVRPNEGEDDDYHQLCYQDCLLDCLEQNNDMDFCSLTCEAQCPSSLH
ncbi:ethylene-responsive transcription factor ERF020-like [Senna tora]|uniref:Ethylene-responsive transcription factor ERF020-like n=1 Tax=Senna tora TaxID=362788 RepID=A0A835CAJ0_9FABA|nr:ethylene-responsive transcription factor ERF020-like [Senna tora]